MNQPAPPSAEAVIYTRTYPGRADQIQRVRAGVRALLSGCPIADDVILCASELTANAGVHSDSRLPGGTFTVRATLRSGDYVRLEIDDDGGPWAPKPSDPGRAHGLDILCALASAWGIDGDESARTAWAHFSWPGE